VGSRLRTHRPLIPTAPVTKEHQFYFAYSDKSNTVKNPNVGQRQKQQLFTARTGHCGDTSENLYVD